MKYLALEYIVPATIVICTAVWLSGCDYTDPKYKVTQEQIDAFDARYPCGFPASPFAPALRPRNLPEGC